MADNERPDEGYFHVDDLNKIPTPLGFANFVSLQSVGTMLGGDGAIEVYVCPNCDKTHLKMSLGGIAMETAFEGKVAELLVRMLNDPQTPKPSTEG